MFRFMLRAALALCLITAGVSLYAQHTKWNSKQRAVKMDDGLNMKGWLYSPPAADNSPLLVLLPMMGNTHESFDHLISRLQDNYQLDSAGSLAAAPYVLALDLRGHGDSKNVGDSVMNYRNMSEAEYGKIPQDVVLFIQSVLRDTSLSIDTSEIMMVGASVGANTAVMTAALLPHVTKLVLLSPGENYRGLSPTKDMQAYKGKTLILACAEDTYADFSSRKLAEIDSTRIDLRIQEGKDHGTSMTTNDPRIAQLVIEWLFNEN